MNRVFLIFKLKTHCNCQIKCVASAISCLVVFVERNLGSYSVVNIFKLFMKATREEF
jgi:hypothetical protein